MARAFSLQWPWFAGAWAVASARCSKVWLDFGKLEFSASYVKVAEEIGQPSTFSTRISSQNENRGGNSGILKRVQFTQTVQFATRKPRSLRQKPRSPPHPTRQ